MTQSNMPPPQPQTGLPPKNAVDDWDDALVQATREAVRGMDKTSTIPVQGQQQR